MRRTMTAAAAVLLISALARASVVGELVEYLGRVFSREVAEAGGERIVGDSLKRLVRRHGDGIVPLVRKLGPGAIRVVERHGDDGVRILNAHGRNGQYALERHGQALVLEARKHGDDVVKAYVRHPGVGPHIVRLLGPEGVAAANKLGTEELLALLRVAPRLRQHGRLEWAIDAVRRSGSEGLRLVLRHPVLTAAGVGAAYLASSSADGTAKSVGSRVGASVGGALSAFARWILAALGILAAAAIVFRLTRRLLRG